MGTERKLERIVTRIHVIEYLAERASGPAVRVTASIRTSWSLCAENRDRAQATTGEAESRMVGTPPVRGRKASP